MAVLCIKKTTKFLYAKNKWHEEIIEKSWVNSVKCLLDRLYKLCLTCLYFFGIYFNVEYFFRILDGRTSLISSNQFFFIKCNFSSYSMFYSYNIYKKMFFQNNKLSFVAAIISIIKSIIFI